MTSLKRPTLPLSLIMLSILAALCHGAEPTEKSKLKYIFESSPVSRTQEKAAQPTILPTHSAVFFLEWYHRKPSEPDMNAVLQTTAGKSISQLQREFIKTAGNMTSKQDVGSSRRALSGMEYSSGKTMYELHAVSKEDAHKMAEAFIEVFIQENNAALKPQLSAFLGKFQDQRAKYLQKIKDIGQKAPEKEQELKDLQAVLADLKKTRWYQSTDQAKKAMLELNAMLNAESIELAGLQAKRKAVERHRSIVEKKITRNDASSLITSWQPILLSLEQKYIDLMIDLDVAKAREETALSLRGQAQEFLDLSNLVNKVDHGVSRLEHELLELKSSLTSLENLLAHPGPPMLPLQIHRNEVKIRPVTVKLVE